MAYSKAKFKSSHLGHIHVGYQKGKCRVFKQGFKGLQRQISWHLKLWRVTELIGELHAPTSLPWENCSCSPLYRRLCGLQSLLLCDGKWDVLADVWNWTPPPLVPFRSYILYWRALCSSLPDFFRRWSFLHFASISIPGNISPSAHDFLKGNQRVEAECRPLFPSLEFFHYNISLCRFHWK